MKGRKEIYCVNSKESGCGNTNIEQKDVKASGIESVDRGAWQATVHGVVRLSD